MKIDFVSDVVCPWCAIGLASLENALAQLGPELGPVQLRFAPFELNPQMAAQGEDITEHLARKYGRTPEQAEQTRQMIAARAAEVGFPMRIEMRARIWNTFDAHRLLHWAETVGLQEQRALKQALLLAYFRDGQNPGSAQVLLASAAAAGLDATQASAVVHDPQRFAQEVREEQAQWQAAGIQSVPAIIINRQHLISGGQPPEVFVPALRQVAQATAANT